MTIQTPAKHQSCNFFCRILALSLSLIMLLSTFPVSAFAASNTVTIQDFSAKTVLNYAQYNALRTGTISAVQKDNVWYYQFKTKDITLLVKASAFASPVGNDYKTVNSTLTAGVMSTSGIAHEARFVYKERVATKKDPRTCSNVYPTYICYMSATASRVQTEVDLICRKFAHVQFEYSEKVFTQPKGGRNPRGYSAEPKNASQYMQALKRTTSNSITTTVIPTFNLTVTNPGSTEVYLNSALYRGSGKAKNSVLIADYIDVAVTTGKAAAAISSGKIPYQELLSLCRETAKLTKSNSEYLSNDKVILTKQTYSCLSSKFHSPIELKEYNDYFRVEVRLTADAATSGNKTQMTVSFGAK